MQNLTPPLLVSLLANELRWQLLMALTKSDLRVHELVSQVKQPINLVSYHLKKMRDAALLTTRRSEFDGRDVYYRLDWSALRQMYLAVGNAIHPAMCLDTAQTDPSKLGMQRILFVCTHNSARSQMAEGLLRERSGGYLEVWSAGSQPTGIHPDAIKTMQALGIDIRGQKSRALAELEKQSFDYVITVCDKARENCQSFSPISPQIHWGLRDPVAISSDKERLIAFQEIAQELSLRIDFFLAMLRPNA